MQEGDTPPDFSLENQDGEEVSLSEYEGRKVVLYFYPRADTPGCTTEACGFKDVYDDIEDENAVVLGVSDDPIDDLKKFEEKYDLPFDLLSDESGEVATEYDAYGEKKMFGNSFDGVFRKTYVIDEEGKVEKIYDDVSPEEHAEEILEVIR
ncbi:MAG: thioredoxin-dependent thiol peroxidase [Halobacteria archaeon]|nr:thioredoxin-dependent thiol peroxidase [Halobacteria archaeon]